MKLSAKKPINRSDLAQMTDLNALRALVIAQRDQLAKRDQVLAQRNQTIQQRDQLIDILTEQLKRLRRLKFGASSERFDPSQQALFEETLNADIAAVEAEIEAALAATTASPADAEASPEAVLKTAPQKPVRTGFPEHLPRVVEIVPASRCSCAECQGPLHQCRMEISEKLDVTPAVYVVRQRHYPVMACRKCENIYGTPIAPEIIEGGIPTAALLAHVTVQKYVDHLPLYRQSEIAKRAGVHLPVSTLAEWMGKVGVALKPLVTYLRKPNSTSANQRGATSRGKRNCAPLNDNTKSATCETSGTDSTTRSGTKRCVFAAPASRFRHA